MTQALTPSSVRRSRKLKVAGVCALGAFVTAIIFLVFAWPFRREAVIKELEDESFSKVSAGSFHGTYFPHPGCVLEHVVFQHNRKSGTPPLIIIGRVRIEGSFAGLFTRHLKLVRAEAMRVLIPPLGSEHFETPQRSSVVIDHLVADGAILEVASRSLGNPPLRFAFRGFIINDVGSYEPASFKAALSNSEPPGEITTTGKFGPWNASNVGKTAVSGDYYFQHADLGAFPGISGMLSSSGKYNGTLEHLEVNGTADVPDFTVTRSAHQAILRTQFRAVVDAENGDVFLQSVNSNFRKTTIWTQGKVAGEAGQPGKTASLEIASKDGRVQDLLLLFAKGPRATMSGMVSFKAHVYVAPGQKPFLERVELRGDFGVDEGSFTKPDTQQGVNSLSWGALGEKTQKTENDEADPQNVLSDLKGQVLLKNGTARFSDLSFSVPGALAQMRGTYNLISEKIDLHGTLKTDGELSRTTHGVKALMLKVLAPFFKNKPGGYVAPVKLTGTYAHPSFGLDLGNRDNERNRSAKVHTLRLPVQSKR